MDDRFVRIVESQSPPKKRVKRAGACVHLGGEKKEKKNCHGRRTDIELAGKKMDHQQKKPPKKDFGAIFISW